MSVTDALHHSGTHSFSPSGGEDRDEGVRRTAASVTLHPGHSVWCQGRRARPILHKRKSNGFTLIELIMVMVVVGALAAIGGIFIVEPFRASADMTQRAALVDQADLALDRVGREVRTALPNSVRTRSNGGLFAVEFVSTRTGGRYRRLRGFGGVGDTLNRAQTSDTFDALGGLPDIDQIATRGAGTDCAEANGDCISIYNTGQTGFNVYAGDNIAAITATTDNGSGTDQLTYNTGGSSPAFAAHSPIQRFFVIDTIVSYVCDPGAGTLRRYADYGLQGTQPLPPSVSGALVATDVSSCSFTYQSGTSTRRGLLKMRLALTGGGETVTLFAQTHVVNAP